MYTQDLILIVVTGIVCSVAVYAAMRRLVANISDELRTRQMKLLGELQTQLQTQRSSAEQPDMPRSVAVSLNGATPVKPGQMHTIQRPVSVPFQPERLIVSGDGQGAQDWAIEGIRIDGQPQFNQAGAVPGDMFAHGVVDAFVTFDDAHEMVEIAVRYVGNDPAGRTFYAAMIGSAKDAGAAHAGA